MPPLALQRCPAVGCGRRLYATLEVEAAPVLACERRHVWLCVRDDSRRDGWRLVYFCPAPAPEAQVAQLDLYRGPPRSSYLLVLTRAQARHAGLDLVNDVVSAERSDPYTCPPLWPGSVGPCGPGELWAWERPADEGAGPAVMPLLARGWAVVVEDTTRRSEVCQRLARAGWPVRYRTGKGLRVYSAPPKIRRPGSAATDPGHNPRHKERTPWDT